MLNDFSLDSTEQIKDSIVYRCKNDKDSNKLGSVSRDKLYSSNKNDKIFVDAENAMTSDEDFFIILYYKAST